MWVVKINSNFITSILEKWRGRRKAKKLQFWEKRKEVTCNRYKMWEIAKWVRFLHFLQQTLKIAFYIQLSCILKNTLFNLKYFFEFLIPSEKTFDVNRTHNKLFLDIKMSNYWYKLRRSKIQRLTRFLGIKTDRNWEGVLRPTAKKWGTRSSPLFKLFCLSAPGRVRVRLG